MRHPSCHASAEMIGQSLVTATAHKLARLYYHLVKYGREYEEGSAQAYEEKHRERTVANLQK